MIKTPFTFCKDLIEKKSLLRIYLNKRLSKEKLIGKTIDIGGGRDADYINFMTRAVDVSFETFDMKAGATVNFETDALPAADGVYDTVLFLNVMEHIFNHQHIANEVVRVTKPGGQVIGFVPFLMWYHPDHSDFFRYTHEALQIIFERAGVSKIEISAVAPGPFTAAAHMLVQSFPSILRPIVFLPFFLFDSLFNLLRPGRNKVFALGYFFVIHK
jgi:SAM-dependent methyltransferase